MTRTRRALALASAGAIAMLVLAGCAPAKPMETPSPSRSASAGPSAAPTPEPVFDGTAAENQAYFDAVNQQLIAAGGTLNGAAFVDNLVARGYSRQDMEVTPDTTSIGIAADNIVFSIRFGDSCLLGQWGNIGYTSLVADVLSTGRCIIGTARPA
ncbi:MAG: hypothetical protein DI534_11895 [Leifsonia xyli]|nr:MAG: hypothetical protein DI534_11895 [Leifsonia xyli]